MVYPVRWYSMAGVHPNWLLLMQSLHVIKYSEYHYA